MDLHKQPFTSPKALLKSIWLNRHLISRMINRQIAERYRGSTLGLVWSFITPLFLLAVYTFVFSVVFKARWGSTLEESKVQFAFLLFIGLITHSLLADILNNAPYLIQGNVNFVKRVVFPLEILPIVSLGAILFHALISLSVLLIALFFFNGFIYWTALLIPLVWLPLLLTSLGIAWGLASLGVFFRDISHVTSIITMVMLFLAPVFYPLEAIPQKYHIWIMLNPLTFIIEQSRNVLIWGKIPNWYGLFIYLIFSLVILWGGFWWFQKTRKGFADVL